MSKAKTPDSSSSPRKIRPAISPEARDNQLIALAYNLVEKRLLEGTASSQETTHFLKLGSAMILACNHSSRMLTPVQLIRLQLPRL